jgi:superfamily II DNA helicase RecQ
MGQPEVLRSILTTMRINFKSSYQVNLGNDRSNICSLIFCLTDGGKDFKPLQFLTENALPGNTLPCAFIYTDSRWTVQCIAEYLCSCVGPDLKDQIDYVHALCIESGKREAMAKFCNGTISIIVATECAGMGADIPNIPYVVKWKLPQSATMCNQRAGQGRRDGQVAIAIMFAEVSAYQEVKKRKRQDSGYASSPEDLEDGLDTPQDEEDSNRVEEQSNADTDADSDNRDDLAAKKNPDHIQEPANKVYHKNNVESSL